MSTTPAAPFHVGLTPQRIVDVAVRLTEQQHLFGWSIRDLARSLDVAPSVIYHHVGGKDLLSRHVVERVLADLVPPPGELRWDEWFRQVLYLLGPLVARYPGVARWLLMHGPTFPLMIPVIDAGVAALQHAGFAEQTGLVYATLFNNALLTVSLSDDRLRHEGDGPRDHAAMMREFQRIGDTSPGVATLAELILVPLTQESDPTEPRHEEYYRFVVDTTIAGVAHLLAGRSGSDL